ncbi:DUF805 domain-containing protein [Sphingomonas sp. TDK1]|uniref:DUF805 domain-containing protein n=1 Tax=Sphingomonas sp. TDK1 TaxID=453247 RepID=UPI0007D94770|nr:DUF805 domain-containing protein [Sphingomonas sp. TDK1]OAN58857.1 hypothetical protein A7X12_04230 [Sphingomonas sp. TDK1]
MTAASYRDGVSLRNGLRAIGQSFVFQGRSTRSELTSALILIAIGELVLFLAFHFFHPPTPLNVALFWRRVAVEEGLALLLFLPLIGLIVRRLHDVGLPAIPGLVLAAIGVAGDLDRTQVAMGLYPGVPLLPTAGQVALVVLAVALYWSPASGGNRFGPDPRAA